MNSLPRLLLLLIFATTGCTGKKTQVLDNLQSHVLRLKPGEDLKESLERYVSLHEVKAGWIVTCAGSLTTYNIRFANQPAGTTASGFFEIVSLTGTLSVNGCHLHLSVSDSTGKTIGGHLLEGCKIYTTAEIILQQTREFIFTREKDGTTPWEELQIKRR